MEAKHNTRAAGNTAPVWRTVSRAAAITALAATVFLAVWSPTSAGVAQSEAGSPDSQSAGVSLSIGTGRDSRSNEADRLARDNSEWFRAAHGKLNATTEVQPLPAQF